METQEPTNQDIRDGMNRDIREDVVTTIRLSAAEHAWLKQFAESQQRTIGGQVRFMVTQLRAQVEEPA